MTASEIERFYDVRKEVGEIRNRISSRRVFILDAQAWNDMADHLSGLYSTGASSIFYNAGKLYAERLMQTSIERTAERNESIRYLLDLVKASGWGSFSLHMHNELGSSQGKIILESNNFLMADRKRTEHPSCFFLKGILQEAGEVLFGAKSKTEETLCRATGKSEVCRFEISFPQA